MTCFHEMQPGLQMALLVLNQITVIGLLSSVLLLRRRGDSARKHAFAATLLSVNTLLAVIMMLNNRLTGGDWNLPLHIPYGLLLTVILLSFGYALFCLFDATKRHDSINNTSVKEAFDNLPTGVCFFNEAGLPVLCNRAMHRFSFAVCDRDVQYVDDLEECLSKEFVPLNGVTRDGASFLLPDGRVWHLERRILSHKDGRRYTQFIAPDITDLYNTRIRLTEENAQLRQVQNDLKQLSANVVAVTREEEILNAKMRVHDEMGRCLVTAQKCLREGDTHQVTDQVVVAWQRAVSMLRYNNETIEEDMLSQIRKTCDSVALRLVQTGTLPQQESAAYLLACAVRECVTNAVRYADASELYADFSETDRTATVAVQNNGNPPEGPIVEGGGLSTLRRRVERAGGTMTIQALPQFKLTVTVPKEKEGIL